MSINIFWWKSRNFCHFPTFERKGKIFALGELKNWKKRKSEKRKKNFQSENGSWKAFYRVEIWRFDLLVRQSGPGNVQKLRLLQSQNYSQLWFVKFFLEYCNAAHWADIFPSVAFQGTWSKIWIIFRGQNLSWNVIHDQLKARTSWKQTGCGIWVWRNWRS